MNRFSIQITTLLLAGTAAFGCKKATEARDSIAPTAQVASTSTVDKAPAAGNGSIRGKVMFAGKPPAPRAIDNHICSTNAKPIFEESLVVNPNGTMKNVVVYLKGVSSDTAVARETPVIDQVDCHYVPHVIAINTGEKVIFKSSDATLHNVHILGEGGNSANFGMPSAGTSPARKFSDVEFTRVKCDVHPWMNCWVAVMDCPYFSVTNETGEFEIKNVPAGVYTLNAWHEKLEPMTQSVTVVSDADAQVMLTVNAP